MRRNILITGANRGFGYALVKEFIKCDDRVIAVVRKEEYVADLVKEFGDSIIPIVADIADDKAIQTINSILDKRVDCIDMIINNAGVTGKCHVINDLSTKEMEDVINVHCLAVIRTYQACKGHLKRSQKPMIINISSRLGSLSRMATGEFKNRKFSYSYRVAKAAQNMLSICMDQELKEMNIRVIAVHPGRLLTRSGAADADTTPTVGAQRFINWVNHYEEDNQTTYIEPGIETIPW
ncbi:SDR family NAD(P)-dependent oxidoreductase [Vallitalea okinawensis]|uniref:SDR family NAD(P)-dependent oxidoreductase n=1 Tax=Vallitalea okinawensis TaxID=2078660 RepID=UPI000CFC3ED5|nr:SDR family NAD(P)-dependent oxidoreductase [Vallitalea okinawensis]